MKIITTKKQTAPTKGFRYSAEYLGTRKYQVFSADTTLSESERHRATAQALADVVSGPGCHLLGGETRDGYAWTCVPAYAVDPVLLKRMAAWD